jgi:hypothetical protein
VGGRGGVAIAGSALGVAMPHALVGCAADRGHGLFRLALDRAGARQAIHLWLSDWTAPAAELRALQERWQGLLDDLFPEREPASRGEATAATA